MSATHVTAGSRRCVVVGASGILAPLGAMLAGPGVVTVGISRSGRRGSGAWDEVVALDATDPDALSAFARTAPPAHLVVAYAPAVTPRTWSGLVAASVASVLVVTSGWADPAGGDGWSLERRSTVVVLGWTGPPSSTRWHDPGEISARVAEAVSAPAGTRTTLGRLRPWGERPR